MWHKITQTIISFEEKSVHRLGKAIVDYAKQQHGKIVQLSTHFNSANETVEAVVIFETR